MNNSAAKVGEIFREAGTAFNKLSEMTLLLHPKNELQNGFKWSEEELDVLRTCVHRFAVDLNKLSHHIKSRTVSQIRTTLKKKAFEDAGIPVRQVSSIAPRVGKPATQVVAPLNIIQGVIRTNAEVTLNMLNATENEVDVEGLTGEVKLEFDGSTEEVNA
ncbi:chromatin complexes subunit BAP18 isoform X2 [Bicyclus anynana]|uniref:Chromatin complexes subunit BAP18 isoform X2 n=1 Tax=Bicyclus anynana TaxID=110368 RepID=A0A6J1MIH3_BICAN|nr:chromatin complexes subunit BAP18 isoform X2 [Bicyclus anynana]